jgi:hypothetical protein
MFVHVSQNFSGLPTEKADMGTRPLVTVLWGSRASGVQPVLQRSAGQTRRLQLPFCALATSTPEQVLLLGSCYTEITSSR